MSSEQFLIVLMFVLIVWQARLIWKYISQDSEANSKYASYLKVYHFDQLDLKRAFTEGFAVGHLEGSGESPSVTAATKAWETSNANEKAQAYSRIASRIGSKFFDVDQEENEAEA